MSFRTMAHALGALVAATAAPAQPKNHIGGPLAEIFLAGGCALSEERASAALKAQGWFQSDVQAQMMALYNGGYLVTAPDGRLKLVRWGKCR